jgi:hypothetical protein
LGEKTQKEIEKYFQNPENIRLLHELKKIWEI